jgi:hypothetical protein
LSFNPSLVIVFMQMFTILNTLSHFMQRFDLSSWLSKGKCSRTINVDSYISFIYKRR